MENFRRILFKQPLLSLAALCFVIAFASPFIFVESQAQKKEDTKKVTPTATLVPSQAEENEQSVQGQTSYNQAAPTVSTQQTVNTAQQVSQPTATAVPQPTSAPVVKTFQVSLKINGSSVGNVELPEGANQCDLLTKAKEQGKIASLLMKYDNSLGTNGVYQINGIGKENAMWWVYKVNGTSPTQGCSYIKANSGDTVEWEYKG